MLAALESAIDELAHELGMDPIDLRMQNEPDRDPTTGAPFSMRSLPEAYRIGAEKFGWEPAVGRRKPCATDATSSDTASRPPITPPTSSPSAARVEIHADGFVIGQSSAQEMGMGTATAQAQNLADQLGMPLEHVRFEYGDSRLPEAPVAGGSSSTVSVGASITAACDAVKRKVHDQIVEDARSPLFATRFDEMMFHDGGIYLREAPARGETFTAILQRFGNVMFDARGDAAHDEEHSRYSIGSYGAQFSEMRVDEATQVPDPFHRDGWIYEEKVDGWRILAYKDGQRVRLLSRTNVDHRLRFRDVASALVDLPAATLVLGRRQPATLGVNAKQECIHVSFSSKSRTSPAAAGGSDFGLFVKLSG